MKNKIIIVVFLLCSFFAFAKNTSAENYQMPIGIPDPGMWGNTHPINSSAPLISEKCQNWPTAETNDCYYVDNTNLNATDSGNIYGYPDKPRLTVPEITYGPGSYVEVHGGPYIITSASMTFDCTAEDICWLRGSPGSMPSIQSRMLITDSKYLIMEYFDFNNITGVALSLHGLEANNICIRNSKFHDMIYPGSSASVVGVAPNQGGSIHDYIFYNNEFMDIGDWQASSDDDYHGINPNLWGRTPPTTLYNFWVLSNTGYHISGNLVQFNGDQRVAINTTSPIPIEETNLPNMHHLYIGKNIHHHNRQTAASVKFSTDSVISQNKVYANYSIASGGASGQVFQEGAKYVWILFNEFYDSDWGIRQSNTSSNFENYDLRVFMIGNVIHHMYDTKENDYIIPFPRNNVYKLGQGIGFEKGYYKRWIVDNTIYDVSGGINLGANFSCDTKLSGNVIAGVKGIDSNNATDLHLTLTQADGSKSLDYGFFEPREDDGSVMFMWAGLPSSIQISLSSFQTSSGQCTHCWEGDPDFIDAVNYNLRPNSSSPLIGKGVRNEIYDIFEQRYGIDIAFDFDGNPRPTTGNWTLGAFEHVPEQASIAYNLTNLISAITSWLGIGNETSDVNFDGVINTRDLGVMMSDWSQ